MMRCFRETRSAWLWMVGWISVVFCMNVLEFSSRAANEPVPLQAALDSAIKSTLDQFASISLKPQELAVSIRMLSDAGRVAETADYRPDARIYPASVVKLFYLAAAQQWLEDGTLRAAPELDRALHDMIVFSYNEATHYVVDLLTDTTSGPELSPEELEKWYHKRNAVNRYFARLGYQNINVNRKPWCEGPYGREMQSIRVHQPNHRNWLTTEATARLMTEIVTGRSVSKTRSAAMMELLRRDPFRPMDDLDDQATGFIGKALRTGDRLWSKAGWTSEVRHDAAYVELAGGPKLVLVIFTEKHAMERAIIPAVASSIFRQLRHANGREWMHLGPAANQNFT